MFDFEKDLKRCPFCGGKARLYKRFGIFSSIGYIIQCQKCKAHTTIDTMSDKYMEIKDGKMTGKFYTRDDNDVINSLVKKWNTRTNQNENGKRL